MNTKERIKILIIEDDNLIRNGLQNFFRAKEYKIFTADTGKIGIDIVKKNLPHIVLLDIGLPDISGLEVLHHIRELDKNIRVIMVSALSDMKTIEKAKDEGASDYVVKPFSMDYLNNVVVHKVYSQVIEHHKRTIVQMIYTLANAFESKVAHTKGHSSHVAKYAVQIAEELKNKKGWEWVSDKKDFLKNSALLHDIGKIKIEDEILCKEGTLTAKEKEKMMKHPLYGSNIVTLIEDLADYKTGILPHHERIDGTGYPLGLKGNDIPGEARIIAVADAYDAMVTDRPYRKGMPKKEAIDRLIQAKGTQFDPDVVDAFVTSVNVKMSKVK